MAPNRLDDEIEVFATGNTSTLAPDDHAIGDLVRRSAESLRSGLEHAREFRARPGHRPGVAVSSASHRRGGGTDVVRPVLIDPLVAIMRMDAVFDEPVPGLSVDVTLGDRERFLAWPVEIVDASGGRIAARLQLLASPSMVVTLLELVPLRTVRFGRDRFVRAGVAALDEIARRLTAAG